MRKVTLVRGARQLLTLRGASGPRRGADLRNLGIIQDGAVLIADGLIEEVGPSRRVENLALARGREVIDASGCVVMPGFVDSHAHVVRGRAAGAVAARAMKTLRAARLVRRSWCGMRHAPPIEAKSGFGITEASEIKILRVHARAAGVCPLTFCLARFPPDHPPREDTWSGLFPMCCGQRKLAEFAEIWVRGGFAVDQARRYLLPRAILGSRRQGGAGRRRWRHCDGARTGRR